MFSPLRNRFGIPGVISVIALVFAMMGGAYAASNNSGGGKATASAKAKRGPRGPKGPTGPTGPAGPQGPAGPAGKDGANGTSGAPGADGKSVEVEAAGAECPEGGSKFKVGGVVKGAACNGAEGEPGEDGEDGEPGILHPGESLPSGATETGSWLLPGGSPAGTATTISFAIPLQAELGPLNVKYVPKGGTPPTECENAEHTGTAGPSNPEASKGFLCVYAASGSVESDAMLFIKSGKAVESGADVNNSIGASITGATLLAGGAVTGNFAGYFGGTWAVTAP